MKDNVLPEGKWEFNQEVTDCFDEMLKRSIPGYPGMRETVTALARNYIKPGKDVLDLGCSCGGSILPLIKDYPNAFFFCCDVSEPMVKTCKENLKPYYNATVYKNDITERIPTGDIYLIIATLTIQFTPIEYRQKILREIYERLQPGGAFIMVEKVLGETHETNNLFVSEYYKIKETNQYTKKQIEAKRKSLEGVLVPITAKMNERFLADAGFKTVDCFWKYLNFAGWIAIK